MSKSTKFKPHLATDADLSKVKYPIAVLPKVDGVRLLSRGGIATGRSMKQYKNKKMTAHFSKDIFDGVDGEIGKGLVTDNLLCSNTTSLVNTIDGDLPTFYMVFDYITPETIDLGYIDRMKHFDSVKDAMASAAYPVDVFTPVIHICENEEQVIKTYEHYIARGYEGVILRSLNGKHKNGRCTANEGAYLRIKPTADAEGVVTRLEEAYENKNEAKVNELGRTERSSHKENKVPKGMIGSLWILTEGGEEMKIGAGKMTHDERIFYFNNPDKIIGKHVKYSFLNTGIKDKVRHGRYISIRAEEDMSK